MLLLLTEDDVVLWVHACMYFELPCKIEFWFTNNVHITYTFSFMSCRVLNMQEMKNVEFELYTYNMRGFESFSSI